MKHRTNIRLITLIAFLMANIPPAFAEIVDHTSEAIPFDQYKEMNQTIGIDLESTKSSNNVKVTQTIHEEKLTEIVKWLQGVGIMNPDITQTGINLTPISLCSVVSTNIATTTLMEVYKNDQKIDALHFVAKMSRPDEYGNDQVNELFSFDFTRSTFNKVNWDKMQPVNLPKVAKNFHYSQWLNRSMRQEVGR